MARTTLQLRKGTQVENAAFTGALGEVTVDTTRKTLVVHDGTTAGGSSLATLVSPAFTGNPTATTQTGTDNSTRIATTAFVKTALAGFTATIGSTDSVTEGTTNKYFTQTRARQSITATGSIAFDQGTGVISYTAPTNLSDFANDVGYLTSASIRTEISASGSISYDEGTGVISYTQAVDSVNSKTGAVVLNTDDVLESLTPTNVWFTNARARSAMAAGTGVTYASSTGTISLTNTSVTVNSKSLSLLTGGSVTLGTDDIAEGTTNKYASATNVRAQLSAGTGVGFSGGVISIGQAVGTTSNPTFNNLTINGTFTLGLDATFDLGTFKVDATNNRVGINNSSPQYELDVTGDVNLTGKVRLSGEAGTSGYIMRSNGTTASPTWAAINTVLPNITELDSFAATGGQFAFTPKNNGSNVTITAPIQALITKNGSTLNPFINTSQPVWFSGISYGDYTLDSSGNIVFSSPPQPGDNIVVRVLVGNTANTINKTYPYRAIDIMTGY